MSVTLNGSTGYLEWAKGAGTMPNTSEPFTLIARVKTSQAANQFAVSTGQSNADRYAALWHTGGSGLLANYRNVGTGDSASHAGVVLTTMKLAAAVFTSNVKREVYLAGLGLSTPNTTNYPDEVSNHDRITIGAYHVNGNSPSFFWDGDIAEVHIFNRALDATDFTTLNADYRPELMSGWVDGWHLKTASDLVSISGTRTLTLVGGVTTSASPHPVTRGSAGPTISVQPSNQTVTAPATASFSVTAAASGGGTLSYQWQRNPAGSGSFTNVSTGTGGTTNSYTTAATSVSGGNANSTDTWRCVITETGGTNPGSVNSNAATLTVNAGATGPTINTHPSNQTVTSPATATFTVAATTSGGALSYQWQRNPGGNTSFSNVSTGTGGTTNSYTTATTTVSGGNANSTDTWRCVVTDSNGSTNSNAATLTVNPAPGVFTNGAGNALSRNNGSAVVSVTLTWLTLVNDSTGISVVTKTNVAVNSSGIFSTSDALLAPGTTYTAVWKESTGKWGHGTAVAA